MIIHASILEHLVADFFIKAAIVGVGTVVVIIAMVVLWRTLGRPRGDRRADEPRRAHQHDQ